MNLFFHKNSVSMELWILEKVWVLEMFLRLAVLMKSPKEAI